MDADNRFITISANYINNGESWMLVCDYRWWNEYEREIQTWAKECLDGLQKMDSLADKGDYQAIGDLLSSSSFQSFSDDATILTRSIHLLITPSHLQYTF